MILDLKEEYVYNIKGGFISTLSPKNHDNYFYGDYHIWGSPDVIKEVEYITPNTIVKSLKNKKVLILRGLKTKNKNIKYLGGIITNDLKNADYIVAPNLKRKPIYNIYDFMFSKKNNIYKICHISDDYDLKTDKLNLFPEYECLSGDYFEPISDQEYTIYNTLDGKIRGTKFICDQNIEFLMDKLKPKMDKDTFIKLIKLHESGDYKNIELAINTANQFQLEGYKAKLFILWSDVSAEKYKKRLNKLGRELKLNTMFTSGIDNKTFEQIYKNIK